MITGEESNSCLHGNFLALEKRIPKTYEMANMKTCPICGYNRNSFERVIRNINLIRCNRCEFVYTDISDESIKEANSNFTSDDTEKYTTIQTIIDEMWHEHIVLKFSEQDVKGKKVLDIGCGNGLLLKKFKKYGWDCYGVDLSSWSEAFADKYGFEYFQGELKDVDFSHESFDLIVCLSTLEHISKPVEFFRDAIHLLKKEGIFYLAGVPNYDAFSIKLGISSFHHNNPPRHCNYFTPKTVKAIEKYGNISGCTIKVNSYGIPEMHRFYNYLTGLTRREKYRNLITSEVQNDSNSKKGKKNKAVLMAYRLLIFMNYYFGRIGGWGDKLEVIVSKEN